MRFRKPTRGAVLIYVMVAMAGMTALISLGVDCAHMRVVKVQLQAAADAAARYAAAGLRTDASTARNNAVQAALKNNADGSPVVVDPDLDVEIGVWDSNAQSFTTLSGAMLPSATAVRVTARRASVRGNAVELFFAKLMGYNSADVSAVAVGAIAHDHTLTIQALCCPWLAGMPDGTHISGAGNGVSAPQYSPFQVTSFPITPGTVINFRNTTGGTGDYDSGGVYGLDGSTVRTTICQAPVDGINSTMGPLNALVGIFLDDSQPDLTPMAPALDFSTAASRNFSTFSPQLKQVFFIGDGLDANNKLQNFVVPKGATRLFLGVIDEQAHWYDNYGSITTTVYDSHIALEK